MEEEYLRFLDNAIKHGKEAARIKAREEARKTKHTGFKILNYQYLFGDAAEEERLKPPIFQDGSWTMRKYCLEYRFMFNGRQVSVYGKDKTVCFQKRLDVITGKKVFKNTLTFGRWLRQWADTYKKPKLTAGSFDALNKYILQLSDKLGSKPLSRLETEDLQEFLSNEKKPNKRIKLASVLSDSLTKAFDTRQITHNPYLAVEYKREKSKSYPVLMPDEQIKVYEAIDDKKYKDLFKVSLCTGMRISELLGLKGSDIDNSTLTITVQRQKDRSGINTEHLKTAAAYRKIDYLPELFVDIKLTKGYIFDITYTAARSYFRRLFEKLKLDFVLHSFRHTFISNCYYAGIRDKQIQQWAGHSKVEVTLNTYTHILKGNSPFIEYVKKLSSTLK